MTTEKKNSRNSRKTASVKKSPGKTYSGKRKSRKSKKSKVYIPLDKIMVLCFVVLILCSAMLFINTFSELNKDGGVKELPETVRPVQSAEQEPESAVNSSAGRHGESSLNRTEKTVPASERKKAASVSTEEKVSPAAVLQENKRNDRPAPPEKKVYRAVDIPAVPPAVNNAKIVILLDDGGQNISHLRAFLKLSVPLTVAVLPKLAYSKESAGLVRESGKELILHQPMQALNLAVSPGPGAVTPQMTLSEISMQIRENVAELGPVAGLNNHEGSLICEDELKIGAVMKTAADLGIYFLDSRTTSQTRVPQAAMSLGLSYFERNIFLDNVKNRKDIISEFMNGVSIANKNGVVIMIGHIWSADILPGIIEEMYRLLCAEGYEFTTVSKSGALVTP